jgi:hypothetical protein
MTLHSAKSKPDPQISLAALLLAAALAGCSSFEGAPLVPTGSVRSAETARPAEYPPVGVTPPAPAPALSVAERDRLRQQLEAARAGTRATAEAPLDRPLPRQPAASAPTPTAQQTPQR